MPLLFIIVVLILAGCSFAPSVQHDESIQRAEARIALGVGYINKGDMTKARENLQLAYEHAPNYYRSQLSLAHYFELVGEPDSAQHLYQSALTQHPNNGDVLNNYGTFLCKQEQYTQADDYFHQAIAQPSYFLTAASYENAALCAMKAGNTLQASDYLKRALDYEPKRARSILTLAKLEIESGELDTAQMRLTQFHNWYGTQAVSLKLLMKLEQKAGNAVQAKQYQERLNDFH
ncbi:pilus assembly protein PilW [Vibrio galatheae]|uniref:Pilus assembly protein PilW n=1 Tax=Vibrio galatheae TaxID=579748 RepID=A0A0F4NMP0_9VIBR|nr:type IV pilus biogenesis/stability protein PilW [Vibrio galatheae]KJY83386.1 pilus assembly protein PilW [Vibrio galatheae]